MGTCESARGLDLALVPLAAVCVAGTRKAEPGQNGGQTLGGQAQTPPQGCLRDPVHPSRLIVRNRSRQGHRIGRRPGHPETTISAQETETAYGVTTAPTWATSIAGSERFS